MRLSLMGFGGPAYPLLLKLTDGVPFLKSQYLLRGYTNYDVMCIGGAGGYGGGMNAQIIGGAASYEHMRVFGGAGGGGGSERVRGLLDSLDDSCDVTVGAAGADEEPAREYTTPYTVVGGGDGGASSFGGTLCRGSGGKGGGPVTLAGFGSFTPRAGNGGAGGVGGSTTAGGGGAGGVSSFDESSPTAGTGGVYSPTELFSTGGGGGAGGVGIYPRDGSPGSLDPALPSAGGRGAYHTDDLSVSSPGGEVMLPPSVDQFNGGIDFGIMGDNIPRVGGPGGGIRATALNSLFVPYGTRAGGLDGNGIVLLLLTKV